jgi:hypothetical protein
MAEKSRRDQANRRQKLGLVWRNRKKISQIIKDYFCLPFFLLIILWVNSSEDARHWIGLLQYNPSTIKVNGGKDTDICSRVKRGFSKRGLLYYIVKSSIFMWSGQERFSNRVRCTPSKIRFTSTISLFNPVFKNVLAD